MLSKSAYIIMNIKASYWSNCGSRRLKLLNSHYAQHKINMFQRVIFKVTLPTVAASSWQEIKITLFGKYVSKWKWKTNMKMGVCAYSGSNTKESTTWWGAGKGEAFKTMRVLIGKQVPLFCFFSLCVSQSGSHTVSSGVFHR